MFKMKLCLGILLSAICVGLAFANEVLKNNDVIQMTVLNLGDSIVIAKIESADVDFDTSSAALASLKKSNVSDLVIAAMIRAQSGERGKKSSELSAAAEIFYIGENGKSPIIPVPITSQNSNRKDWIPFASGGNEQFFFIEGITASTVVNSAPNFISRIPPDRLRLVRLGIHKTGDRYVVFNGARSDRVIPLSAKLIENGIYQLNISEPLTPGEYALMVIPDNSNAQNGFGQASGMMAYAMSKMAFFTLAYDFKIL